MKIRVASLSLVLIFSLLFLLNSSCEFNPHSQGQWLYQAHCANCHMDDGTGLANLIPSLHNSPNLTKTTIYHTGCLIKYGIKKTDPLNPAIEIYPMPPLPDISETEIANILNYIGNHFGNDAGFINPAKLRQTLSKCPNEAPREWR